MIKELIRLSQIERRKHPDNQAARFTLAAIAKLKAGEVFEATMSDNSPSNIAGIKRLAAYIGATVSVEKFERGIKVRLEPQKNPIVYVNPDAPQYLKDILKEALPSAKYNDGGFDDVGNGAV
jgi:hypothetical protein